MRQIIPPAFITSLPVTPPGSIPKLVLLDRDGCINVDVGSPGVIDPSEFILTAGAAEAVGHIKRSSSNVVLITNQSCVGKGLLDPQGLDDIHAKMERLLETRDADAKMDAIYACLSTKEDGDPRMKPNCGMILEALRDFDVESEDAVFIGDTLTDLQAATRANIGLKILVQTGYGLGLMNNCPAETKPEMVESVAFSDDLNTVAPFVYAANLAAGIDWLLGGGSSAS